MKTQKIMSTYHLAIDIDKQPERDTAIEPSSDLLKYLATALTVYAERNGEFKDLLTTTMSAVVLSEKKEMETLPHANISLLVPKDTQNAVYRMEWLISNMNSTHEASDAVRILADWNLRQKMPQPQTIILGLKVGVLPIGLMGQTKADEEMPIIARADILKKSTERSLRQLMVAASTSVVSRAYRVSGKNLESIDPALLDWFFGKKKVCFFTGSSKEMGRLVSDLKRLSVTHSVSFDETGPVMIATSPIVHPGNLELFYDLSPEE
ncbi:MAG: hypothetical protein A2942_04485 [Candidatus Lloydbacteria bacterium RIFCSPLOWO2_01_FULL_50_20]|uniref:Uncharacterized protein n=1 Tax=Candidatus Lloydbacteria bacterium RIFCSPLOWO2_01_FULL_50_20 TaxID=1798665 RepID=A0A1G2DCW6_9BACT|nr:MAG: hypothetical protein A3C13_03080 [Candidatus Lloydbacteria bacterium RIFCSPHIGHO2_02_FULL_50_11]OGZ11474.1 MAG: hypothetical protein A2942_04485 [Candidatus Lloydbacteria bacterium RIFCSPLOWO2_01_FULL_50_20]